MTEYKIKIFVINILKLPVNASIQCVLDMHCQKCFSLKDRGHELNKKWLPALRSLLPDVQ